MHDETKLAAIFPTLAESDLPIGALDLEVASRNSLLRSEIHTVAQLLQLTHTKLVGLFPNRGLPFYSEIISRLACLACSPKTGETKRMHTEENLPDGILGGKKKKKFNIFQVAGIWKSEEIHTRIIAELLNPNSEFHDMGTAFLQTFLEKLGLEEYLSSKESVKVETEVRTTEEDETNNKNRNRRIDMVIETEKYYLPFEVKIWAEDQKDQLFDYYRYACSKAKKSEKDVPFIYYLTPDGHAPSDWSLGSTDDKLPVCTLSFQEAILPWLNDCITNTALTIPADVLEIMKQLRDNIHPGRPGREPGFYLWQGDILDDIYQSLCEQYDLPWTECTNQYMTFTLHKEKDLEFALRIKKESSDSVSLHLICGLTQGDEKPDYALAGPYIHDPDHAQEYSALLSSTFSKQENISGSTGSRTWDRMKVIYCKNQDGACIEKIKEVFSWLKDGIEEDLKIKS